MSFEGLLCAPASSTPTLQGLWLIEVLAEGEGDKDRPVEEGNYQYSASCRNKDRISL